MILTMEDLANIVEEETKKDGCKKAAVIEDYDYEG
jgi:hypothetical protein